MGTSIASGSVAIYALVKLWRATGNQRYFDLARFFIETRGTHYFAVEHNTPLDRYDGAYWQDDVPIREHRAIKGHAVRAAYLMSGVTDIVALIVAVLVAVGVGETESVSVDDELALDEVSPLPVGVSVGVTVGATPFPPA